MFLYRCHGCYSMLKKKKDQACSAINQHVLVNDGDGCLRFHSYIDVVIHARYGLEKNFVKF